MKKRIRFLSLVLALLTVVGVMYIPTFPAVAASDEATLTITAEGGTPAVTSGTFNAMYSSLYTELAKNPEVKTTYELVLNKNASFTSHKSLKANANCFVTVKLNGYTLNVTNLKNNIFTLENEFTFVVDGADASGKRALIHNDGICGALIFVNSGRTTANMNATVKNLELYATKMDQGFSAESKYPNQPMCSVSKGDLTMQNVKMTYTGENAVAMEGKDLANMTTNMIYFAGGGKCLIEDSEIIDTSNKGINVRGIATESASAGPHCFITVRNTKISAKLPIWNNKCKIQLHNCDVSANDFIHQGGGTYFFNSVIRIDNGVVGMSSSHNVELYPSGEGDNIVYSSVAPQNVNVASGWELVADGEGKYVMKPTGSVEATKVIIPEFGAPSVATGTYQAMHESIANVSSATSKTDYLVILNKDASYTAQKQIIGNSLTDVRIDLNGFTLTVPFGNNIYQIYGASAASTVGGINFTIDGSDASGKRGKIISTGVAGAIAYVRNENRNTNTVLYVENIELVYTNLSQGFRNTTDKYPGQGMANITKGDAHFKNVKITYTGEEATCVAGSAGSTTGLTSDIYTEFIEFSGGTLTVDNCEFIDTNTKDIQVSGIIVGNAASKVTVTNTKIECFKPIVASKTHVIVKDSVITAKNRTTTGDSFAFTISNSGSVSVISSEVNVSSLIATSATTGLYFIYGDKGDNVVKSAKSLEEMGMKADYAQAGYVFAQKEAGVYIMNSDASAEASIAVVAPASAPIIEKGTYNAMRAKLSRKPSVRTEIYLTLLKDASYQNSSTTTPSFNENCVVYIDHDGHDFTSLVSNNIYQVTGNFELHMDGADRDGNAGTVFCDQVAGAFLYTRRNDGLNDKTVAYVTNFVMKYTNLSNGFSNSSSYPNQPIFQIPAGTVTFENVKMQYDGSNATTLDPENKPLTNMTTHLVTISYNADVTMNNCEVTDTNTKGIPTVAVVSSGTGNVELNNCKLSARIALWASTSNSIPIAINGGEITGSEMVYRGTGFVVTDAKTTVQKALSEGSSVKFMYGTGKTEIVTPAGENPSNAVVENGYILCRKDATTYVVDDGEGYASVRLPAIFASGMVFQRGKEINIFGTCKTNGASIEVEFDGVKKTATVANGEWKVSYPAKEAAKGLTLKVKQLGIQYSTEFVYTDIGIGEVWVNSGQSNADYELYKMEDAAEYLAYAELYDIRVFSSSNGEKVNPDPIGKGEWFKATPETAKANNTISQGDIPAIAYVMAVRIAMEEGRNVPVAILHTSRGGANVRTYISEENYPAEGDRQSTKEYPQLQAYKEFWAENGRYPKDNTECSYYTARPYGELATANYNGKIHPMKGFNVKGVLWYQGCSNTNFTMEQYTVYLNAIKKTFRDTFNNANLPFVVIQLHPQISGGLGLHAAQYASSATDKNCYTVSAYQEGTIFESSDYEFNETNSPYVHPSRKSPIGHRVADTVLGEVYGIADYKGLGTPYVLKVEKVGSSIVITFDQNMSADIGSVIKGFQIAGADGVFYEATAVASGKKVTLTAAEVSDPASVKYGFGKGFIELEDGTMVPFDSAKATYVWEEGLTKITYNGTTYQLSPDSENVIRTSYNGNLIGDSGHNVPVFWFDVGFTSVKAN